MRDNCSTVSNTENALLAVGSAWMGGGCNNRAVAWCQLREGLHWEVYGHEEARGLVAW